MGRFLDLALFMLFFSASLFTGWLLSLAFPYGFGSVETIPFEDLARHFQLFGPNAIDWYRTVPYGLILIWSWSFPNPSIVSYWICTLGFSLSIGLVYILGLCLFSSRALAAMMAATALIFEITCMHVFFYDLRLCAEPMIAVLVQTGTLASLIGWLSRRASVFLVGYGLLGMAALFKPEAMSLFFVWLPFAIALRRHWNGKIWMRNAIVGASIVLLLGPVAVWSLRNFILYGYPKTSACGGLHFMQSVMPLVENQDVLFDDPVVNKQFISTLRTFNKAHEVVCRRTVPNPQRCWALEVYLWASRASRADPPGPLDVLAQVVMGDGKVCLHDLDSNSALMFKVESEAMRVGMRIISQHPLAYLRQVLGEYTDLWTPTSWWTFDYEQYYADPRAAYSSYYAGIWDMFDYYPGRGKPDGSKSNAYVGLMFGRLNESVPLGLIVACLIAAQAVLAPLMFFGAVVCLMLSQRKGSILYQSEKAFRVSVILILLYAAQAAHFLLIGLVHVQRGRYGMIGDMGVHLMYIIALVALAPELVRRLKIPFDAKINTQGRRIAAVVNLPDGPGWRSAITFLAVFFASLLGSSLISAAFPYGLANAQTAGFVRLAENFCWLTGSPDEWYATMPGVIIIALSNWFANPSNWLFWLYSVLFAVNVGLFSLVASRIFRSRLAGIVLGLAAILLELLIMRVSFFNLQIDSRPLFAHLSLAGGLLAVLAWQQRSKALCMVASALLGIASIAQLPDGFAVVLFWSVCLLVFCVRLGQSFKDTLRTIACCWLLLMWPIAAGSWRNLAVYGYFTPTGCQGLYLLNHVSPLTADDLFPNLDEKTKLITSETNRRDWLNGEILKRIENRSLRELHCSLTPDGDFNQVSKIDSDSMFVLNDAAYYQALIDISRHANEVLKMTWNGYVQIFSNDFTCNPSLHHQTDPELVYQDNKHWLASIQSFTDLDVPFFKFKKNRISVRYARLRTSDASDCDPTAVTILGLINNCFAVQAFRGWLVRSQFLCFHLIVLMAALIVICKRTIPVMAIKQMDKLAVVILLISLPAAFNLLFAASTISTAYPFLMESELSLHLTILLAVFAAIGAARKNWFSSEPGGPLNDRMVIKSKDTQLLEEEEKKEVTKCREQGTAPLMRRPSHPQ